MDHVLQQASWKSILNADSNVLWHFEVVGNEKVSEKRFVADDVSEVIVQVSGQETLYVDKSTTITHLGVFKLRDGRFVAIKTGWWTDGWKSYDSITAVFAAKLDELVIKGMSENERRVLKILATPGEILARDDEYRYCFYLLAESLSDTTRYVDYAERVKKYVIAHLAKFAAAWVVVKRTVGEATPEVSVIPLIPSLPASFYSEGPYLTWLETGQLWIAKVDVHDFTLSYGEVTQWKLGTIDYQVRLCFTEDEAKRVAEQMSES